MVIFKNANYGNFLFETKDKRIICYGAGGTMRDFLKNNRAHISVLNKIDYILDRDRAKSGSSAAVGLKDVPIMTVEELTALDASFSEYVIILCLADKFVLDALSDLDRISIFNGLACYYGISALSWSREHFVPAPSGKSALPSCKIKYDIPKVIHYTWFGERSFGEIERECIESWGKACPDFELKLWNEENYDISEMPLYARQAHEAKKYAFVSDYARLDIVYRYGGFYLDTDVLLFRSLEDFKDYKAVFGYLPYNEINSGLGFGSVAGNVDLFWQMSIYENVLFVNDGELNLTPCPEYTTDYFRSKGIDIDNRLKLVDGTLFLPSDFLCSLMPVVSGNGMWYLPLYELTENSYAIHMCTSTWFNVDMLSTFDSAKNNLAGINSRLLADWKREHFA